MSRVITTGIISYEEKDGLVSLGAFEGSTVPTNANIFAQGCILTSVASGKVYTNAGTSASPSFQDINDIQTSEIAAGAITLAKLATGVLSSHIVKFFKLGSTITTTALTGLAVGDLIVTILADGTVTVEVCATINTLPSDPADTSYVIVFRVAA